VLDIQAASVNSAGSTSLHCCSFVSLPCREPLPTSNSTTCKVLAQQCHCQVLLSPCCIGQLSNHQCHTLTIIIALPVWSHSLSVAVNPPCFVLWSNILLFQHIQLPKCCCCSHHVDCLVSLSPQSCHTHREPATRAMPTCVLARFCTFKPSAWTLS